MKLSEVKGGVKMQTLIVRIFKDVIASVTPEARPSFQSGHPVKRAESKGESSISLRIHTDYQEKYKLSSLLDPDTDPELFDKIKNTPAAKNSCLSTVDQIIKKIKSEMPLKAVALSIDMGYSTSTSSKTFTDVDDPKIQEWLTIGKWKAGSDYVDASQFSPLSFNLRLIFDGHPEKPADGGDEVWVKSGSQKN
jgi:hypothetical protein